MLSDKSYACDYVNHLTVIATPWKLPISEPDKSFVVNWSGGLPDRT